MSEKGSTGRSHVHVWLIPLTCAALLAGPLAAAAVFLEWWRMLPEARPAEMSGALWAARAFLARFDLAVVVLIVPCYAVFVVARPRVSGPAVRGTAP